MTLMRINEYDAHTLDVQDDVAEGNYLEGSKHVRGLKLGWKY